LIAPSPPPNLSQLPCTASPASTCSCHLCIPLSQLVTDCPHGFLSASCQPHSLLLPPLHQLVTDCPHGFLSADSPAVPSATSSGPKNSPALTTSSSCLSTYLSWPLLPSHSAPSRLYPTPLLKLLASNFSEPKNSPAPVIPPHRSCSWAPASSALALHLPLPAPIPAFPCSCHHLLLPSLVPAISVPL
jgi:hypothetical protein